MRLIAYYAHPERGRKHEREDAARILNEFQRYYVTRVAVGQSYTQVWLYGFEQEIGRGFNSVFFDFYCEETKRCVDVPYELERPTVLGLFDVSELSVRRSEDTERTAASRNDTGKLHGNGYRAEGIVVDSTMSQERVNHESTNDLISRAEAVEAIRQEAKEWEKEFAVDEDHEDYGHYVGYVSGMYRAKNVIRYVVPSAPEPMGEWVEVEVFPEVYDIEGVKTWGSEMQCDQCGFRHTAIEGHMAQYNFCPNCGADMRGEKE